MFPKDEQIATVTGNRVPEAPPPLDHRGLFGMKGGLRDVVGILGDAFLQQAGRAPIYIPQRQQELEANALQGYFDGNEVDKAAALARYGQRNPQGAIELKKNQDTQDLTKAYRESTIASRDEANAIRREVLQRQRNEAFYKYSGGLVKGANPATWPTIRNRILKLQERFGIKDEDIPEQYDEDWVNTYGNMGMTGYQATRAEQIGEDTDSKIANRRPPQPRAAARPVAIMRNGRRVWVRPEEAYGQEAPPPGKSKGGDTQITVPSWWKPLGPGRWLDTKTGVEKRLKQKQ